MEFDISGNPLDPYIIQLQEYGIYADGTNPEETTKGINDALIFCSEHGIKYVKFPKGIYAIDVATSVEKKHGIIIPSDIYVDFNDSEIVEEPNDKFAVSVVTMQGIANSVFANAKIKGDLYAHKNALNIDEWEQGSIDQFTGEDIEMFENVIGIRTGRISKIADGTSIVSLDKGYGINNFVGIMNNQGVKRVEWSDGTVYSGEKYYIYWYKNDVFMRRDLILYSKVIFTPEDADSFRIWLPLEEYTDRKIIACVMLPDWYNPRTQTWEITYPTQEFSHGISVNNTVDCKLKNLEVYQCVADAICCDDGAGFTNIGLTVENCDLHDCRRQGISIVGGHDYLFKNTKFHDIQGTLPECGIDVEYEGNKPRGIVEIDRCEFYDNNYGDISNANGIGIVITNSKFYCTDNPKTNASQTCFTGSGGRGMTFSNCVFQGKKYSIGLNKEDSLSNISMCRFIVDGDLSICNSRQLDNCNGISESVQLWQSYTDSKNKEFFEMKNSSFKADKLSRASTYDSILDSKIITGETNNKWTVKNVKNSIFSCGVVAVDLAENCVINIYPSSSYGKIKAGIFKYCTINVYQVGDVIYECDDSIEMIECTINLYDLPENAEILRDSKNKGVTIKDTVINIVSKNGSYNLGLNNVNAINVTVNEI